MRTSLAASLGRLCVQATAGPSTSTVATSSACAARVVPASYRALSTSSIVSPSVRPQRKTDTFDTPSTNRSFTSHTTFALNNIGPLSGPKKSKRLGRGPGSGRGGTSTRGHKGQNARRGNGKPVPGFAGGQAPMTVTTPKRGFVNAFAHETVPLNLGRIQQWIDFGRLDPTQPITVRELYLTRCIHSMGDGGVKLLAQSANALQQPIDIVVSRASKSAIEAVEAAGGNITCKFYTPHSLRALVKPHKWTDRGRLVPEEPLPINQRDLMYYTDIRKRGYLAKMNRNGTLGSVLPGLVDSGATPAPAAAKSSSQAAATS